MKKRAARIVLSAAAMSAALAVSNPVDVYAAENDSVVAIAVAEDGFSVAEVSAILWTNVNTSFLASPDDAAVVAPNVGAGLPVNVTGITSNGYFRIDLNGQTLYVNGIGLEAGAATEATAVVPTVEDTTGWTPEKVYNAIMALQSKYPEGMPWSREDYTYSDFPTLNGTGCNAFAAHILDDVFGREYAHSHMYSVRAQSVLEMKPGDVVHAPGHYMVVLTVGDDYITVAEGNYNGTVHWGRKVKEEKLWTELEDVPDSGCIRIKRVY